jgi:hypothetical protein
LDWSDEQLVEGSGEQEAWLFSLPWGMGLPGRIGTITGMPPTSQDLLGFLVKDNKPILCVLCWKPG